MKANATHWSPGKGSQALAGASQRNSVNTIANPKYPAAGLRSNDLKLWQVHSGNEPYLGTGVLHDLLGGHGLHGLNHLGNLDHLGLHNGAGHLLGDKLLLHDGARALDGARLSVHDRDLVRDLNLLVFRLGHLDGDLLGLVGGLQPQEKSVSRARTTSEDRDCWASAERK
eukprot:3744-Rhodomonas_salina.1